MSRLAAIGTTLPTVRRVALGALSAAVLGLPAAAQVDPPPVTYPPALDRTALVSWLGKETDIRPETVAAVTPEAVISILQSRRSEGSMAVVVRGEVLTPEVFARDRILSWHATVQVDCAGKRVRQGLTTGYAARNLLFDGRPVRPADADWRKPAAGEALDQVRLAVCEPAFQPPLTASDTAAVALSQPQAPKPVPKPAPKTPQGPVPPKAAAPPQAVVPPRPATTAKVSAQVVAAGSAAEATRMLEKVKARFPDRMAGLEGRVVRAVVGGKTYHRAIIAGFADRAGAAAFCVALQAGDQACFVRGDLGQ